MSDVRDEIVQACRVLSCFRMVEGFGHVSARVGDRFVITPRKALGLIRSAEELVELDGQGRQVGGQGSPPLEVWMHLAVFQRRPDVNALCRVHPRHVAAFASAAEPIRVAHGFGANLGSEVPIHPVPYLVTSREDGIRARSSRLRARIAQFARCPSSRARTTPAESDSARRSLLNTADLRSVGTNEAGTPET